MDEKQALLQRVERAEMLAATAFLQMYVLSRSYRVEFEVLQNSAQKLLLDSKALTQLELTTGMAPDALRVALATLYGLGPDSQQS